ncbi:MAG TPA: glycosyltransferase [Tepidisphaeraceae bacterium]|jgi:glycosyltransferase involved in cell wall biosynthesis/predicted metal-dependent phosphoesterase TrpH
MFSQPPAARPVRIDLHCHSAASSEAGEAVLGAINCPESFSDPAEVYAQARKRGMDFVTITDHDCITGVQQLLPRKDVLVGEELTCYFPEDRCKMHVLVWGIGQAEHDALQAMAHDIYQCAEYIEQHRLAHAVAHPVYRQNDRLEKWHIERLLLLFKGFECLNGAHSLLHRQAFEPLLDELTPQTLAELAARHGIEPRWPEPWRKTRTAGSDDHGLFNIGRTYTEFPAGTDSIEKVLDCLREGRCTPAGEAGSSLKLAHNFYSVGIRYHTRCMAKKETSSTAMLKALVGERTLRKRDLFKAALSHSVGAVGRRIRRPLGGKKSEPTGVALLSRIFRSSLQNRISSHKPLVQALRNGDAPLAEHEAMFRLICDLDRDATAGIANSVAKALAAGKLGPAFDALSSVACQQFMLMPYYFALFHQNRERHLLPRVTGYGKALNRENLKLGVFTDTFEDVNGVSRFLQTIGHQAAAQGRNLTIHTCSAEPKLDLPYRKNFRPTFSCPLPAYPQLSLSIPPLAEVLEWADRQQFDAIHVHTPGPMGLVGWLAASMLNIPLLSTYHTDFPAYVLDHTADHRLTVAAESYMRWFYTRSQSVFTRSRQYGQSLAKLGLAQDRLNVLPPCVDTETFSPRHRDPNYWHDRRIREPYHLLYCGRVSAEKNLGVLAESFKALCKTRRDVALVIAGDGPQQAALQKQLAGLPAYFLGRLDDAELAPLYANSDLLLFPSRTDTLGQVVMEAQACGLPVLVGDEGGPREVMDDGVTGLILPATDARAWTAAVEGLLNDEPRRQRMSRTAPHRVARYNPARTFDAYWDEHVRAAQDAAARHAGAALPPPLACDEHSRGAASPTPPRPDSMPAFHSPVLAEAAAI